MKRLLLFITLAVAFATARGQSGLQINRLFDGAATSCPGVTEIVLQGGALKDYKLDEYHSLTFENAPEKSAEIEALIRHDATSATDREITYRDGGIYYAFYQLPSVDKQRRYIFYLNQHRTGGNKIMLIYLAGKATAAEIKRTLNVMDKK